MDTACLVHHSRTQVSIKGLEPSQWHRTDIEGLQQLNTQGQRSQWEGTESDGEQWAAQHFQIGLEVLVSWELDSRGAIVIFWGKGDFSAAMAGREQPG